MFRLDRQRWTRQPGTRALTLTGNDLISTSLHLLTLGWLALGVLALSGLV